MMLLALLMAAAPADDTPWQCEDPGPQQEMNYCAHQDYLKADEAMNVQWKTTAAVMKEHDAEGSNYSWDDRPGYFATLLKAQRAWLKFRDAQCTSEGYIFRGGSMEPFMVATCKTALTKERTEQLRELVEVE
ncbi:MAG: lysozyme inhibitor LprI family protein [Novosphingobium sp.]|nr:lysozyme inhibitor LprI family protein [Novosphingobium sp.]